MTNPLLAYRPHPRVYVKLPSCGAYYAEGVLDTKDHEIGVCAMSAKDEMMLNNPEALMNGRALCNVIENCVPAIKNALELTSADVEVLMLAIRLASGHKTYEVGGACPKCEQKGVFERDIDSVLQSCTYHKEEATAVLDTGLIVHLRPNSWRSHSTIQQMAFQRQRMMQMIGDPDLDPEYKKNILQEIFDGMVELNMMLLADCISYIETPEASVSDTKFIREYIELLDKDTLNKMSTQIETLNNIGAPHTMSVVCSNPECQHEWDITGLRYDPSDFFAQSSSIAR